MVRLFLLIAFRSGFFLFAIGWRSGWFFLLGVNSGLFLLGVGWSSSWLFLLVPVSRGGGWSVCRSTGVRRWRRRWLRRWGRRRSTTNSSQTDGQQSNLLHDKTFLVNASNPRESGQNICLVWIVIPDGIRLFPTRRKKLAIIRNLLTRCWLRQMPNGACDFVFRASVLMAELCRAHRS